MRVNNLLQLLDSLPIPVEDKNALRESRSLVHILNAIEHYRGLLFDEIDKYHDIVYNTQIYKFAGLTQKHSLAPDNSRWCILVFPAGVGMTLIENYFQQTLMYSRNLIEKAEYEVIIPPSLRIPKPIYHETFLKEFQKAAEFKNKTQITIGESNNEYIVLFSSNIPASTIDENLPETKNAIKNYRPNQPPPREQESIFSKISKIGGFFSRENEESNPERTPLLSNRR